MGEGTQIRVKKKKKKKSRWQAATGWWGRWQGFVLGLENVRCAQLCWEPAGDTPGLGTHP